MDRRTVRTFLAFALASLFLALVACGGYKSSTQNTIATNTPAQTVAVGITDAPGDGVVNFTVTINSINLISSTNASVSLVSTPTTIEVTHLAGTTFPLGHASIPAGTYNKAEITISNPIVTILDPGTGKTITKNLPAAAVTITVALNPPLVVGSTAMAINFDLNVFGSVSIDASGNVTFTPQFRENHGEMHPGDEDDFHGGVDDVAGTVSGTTASGFTIKVGTQSLTFTTNGSTKFEGVSGLSGLTSGMLVKVDAQTQNDGSLLATEVKVILPPGGMEALELDGLVLGVTGTPATQLQLLTQHGEGGTFAAIAGAVTAGGNVNVTVNSSTKFSIETGNVSLSGLPFTPTFTSSTVHAGERVETELPSTTMTTMPTSITASSVKLEQQAINGTVSALGSSTFTLTLASNSALTTAAHVTTVTVFKQPNTTVEGTLANGAKVTVRGLLFFDGGAYKLVTGRIEVGDTD